MATLDIHLQEGFEGEEVVVRVDGEERLRRDAVRTRRALALAEHVSFDVDAGPRIVEVSIPTKSIEKRLEVEVRDRLYIGLGLAGDELRVRIRDKPFGYG